MGQGLGGGVWRATRDGKLPMPDSRLNRRSPSALRDQGLETDGLLQPLRINYSAGINVQRRADKSLFCQRQSRRKVENKDHGDVHRT